MRYIIVLAVFLLCAATVWANDDVSLGKHYFALAQPASIYAEPEPDSRVLAQLEPGAELTLGRFIKLKEIDGRYWRWYAVDFEFKGVVNKGYIWTPEIYANDRLRYGDARFYAAVQYLDDLKKGTATLYAQFNDVAVSVSVDLVSTSSYSLTAIDTGLQGIETIVLLSVSNEACGYPDEKHYFAWTGKELLPLQSAIYFFDEWAGISYHERIIWPKDGAPEGTFIKVTQAVEIWEDEYGGYHDGQSRYATQVYEWNGHEAMLYKQDDELLNWWQPDKYDW